MAAQPLKLVPDSELLLSYRKEKNMAAMAELYRRYAHLVLGMCIKYMKDKDEAKDAMAQVFEKLLKELLHTEVHNFKGWLGFVTRNHCISLLRKKGAENERITELSYYSKTGVETEEAERLIEKETTLSQLEQSILELNEEQRLCIQLFYIERSSYAEVSAKTGFDLKAVKSHLQNGKRNLKLLLEKNAHVPKQ